MSSARNEWGTWSAKAERLAQLRRAKVKNSKLWFPLQGAERNAKPLAGAADAEYRDCSCCGAERGAESLAGKCTLSCLPRELMPNPSFKPSPNGGPPGPVWRYAVPRVCGARQGLCMALRALQWEAQLGSLDLGSSELSKTLGLC